MIHWLTVPKQRKRGVHRRKRMGWQQEIRENVWPSMGMQAWLRWVLLKLQREAEDPHKIAGGTALGMWINFVPIPGLGAASSIFLAWLFRLNIVGAFVGQLPGNPWTFPFFWWGSYVIGRQVMPLSDDRGFKNLMANFNFDYVTSNFNDLLLDVWLPMFVGGQIIGIPVTLLTYWLVHKQVRLFWEHRRERQRTLRERRLPKAS